MRDETVKLSLKAAGPATERPISIAIVAMGGQGGGVLTDWIVQLGENMGWVAQSTSVPGVAQRTGATIYYVEMLPMLDGRKPILAQMPTPGDVDVVIASEFMEAGRSILRGIVTPDRTTLIASNHRALSIIEKIVPGEGIADNSIVSQAVGVVAKREIIFDMDALATQNGSVISSAMFGALAGAEILPFTPDHFINVIRANGKGVEASVRTFNAALKLAISKPDDLPPPILKAEAETIPTPAHPRFQELVQRIRADLPVETAEMAEAGFRKVVDYQDIDYGREYLEILKRLVAVDKRVGGAQQTHFFATTGAKYLANAMTYDDVIRVADLKTRPQRRERIEKEMVLRDSQVMQTTEFMHPRIEEINGILPVALATWIESRPKLYAWLDRRVNKGRRIRTYSLAGFSMLYVVGGLRWLRRRSLRHKIEQEHRDDWLAMAERLVEKNYQLGVEVLKCQRLIKGYSDTHKRGLSKFGKVTETIKLIEQRDDAADWARRLREAAIKDASESPLDSTIATIKTFA